jgi:hypothetical protein
MSTNPQPHTVDAMQLESMAQRIADQAIARFDAKHPEREKEAAYV